MSKGVQLSIIFINAGYPGSFNVRVASERTSSPDHLSLCFSCFIACTEWASKRDWHGGKKKSGNFCSKVEVSDNWYPGIPKFPKQQKTRNDLQVNSTSFKIHVHVLYDLYPSSVTITETPLISVM